MLTDDQKDLLRDALADLAKGAEGLTLDQARQIAGRAGIPLRSVEHFALSRGIVPVRYDRNIPALAPDDQARLLAGRAVVVGLGGLGGCVLECLARLGVGAIVVADGDAFDESNLNRQLLADLDTVGASKVACAAARVARINPAVELVAHEGDFESLDDGAFAGCDVVFDCLDTLPARRELARRCAGAGSAIVHGAIAGWCGQVGVCPPGSDLIDKLYAQPLAAGRTRGIEQALGNLPFAAALAANLMAAEGVKLLLGHPSRQRLHLFDLKAGEWETIDL